MARPFQFLNPNFPFLQKEIEGLDLLVDLAFDMRWSWNHSADKLWKQIDPQLWDLTHNPWVVLQTASRDKIEKALKDKDFRSNLDAMIKKKDQEAKESPWFDQNYKKSPLTCIAYFSMEFMISEALPIYSGGLGNVAGDQLKATSDLGIPVVGVGLLYQQGYFRQMLNKDGSQEALYPYNDPMQLPISPLRQENGEWLRLEVALPGHSLWLRAWQVQVGRRKLYLLDSNDAGNMPIHRGITSELYGGGLEQRLNQEIVLGIGGWRLLCALKIKPEVCHLNEGHAAFAILERARCLMEEFQLPFDVALATTRAGNVFTTHTAVPAGFDRFPPQLIKQYLTNYAQNKLGISIDDLLALGRNNPHDPTENFNMAYLALHGSGAVNGVSRLHGKVSRQVFSSLFPRWPVDEIPIGYVTNGIHTPSWDSQGADDIWTKACGKQRWRGPTETLENDIRAIPDDVLWEIRNKARKGLVEFARGRLPRQLGASGCPVDMVERAKSVFNPDVLTLGFARRFATYKRPNLLLHDPDRFVKLLTHARYPVQLVVAGKAHPADEPGKNLIKQWIQFIQNYNIQNHVIFLSDYDMLLTEHLVQGVDVWINTPRRPWEACGTSGMKVLVNGGINLSELDGWWAEAYCPEVGWALGDGKEHGDDPAWDKRDAESLYTLLETQVIPEFYNRDQKGIPMAWIARMRESMARLTPQYSANRAVREYTESYYLPAAKAYAKRADNSCAEGKQLAAWRQQMKAKWSAIKFGEMKVETKDAHHHFSIFVSLNGIDPESVRVELYANNNGTSIREPMKRVEQLREPGWHEYQTVVSAEKPVAEYTARILPFNRELFLPLESPYILWQR